LPGLRATSAAAFCTQDIGLLHANSSSSGFLDAVERLGGMDEALRISKRDLWRNLRVPFIHSLPGYDDRVPDWIPVPVDAIPQYSSAIGVPIRGLQQQSGNTSFVMQTNYETVDVSLVLRLNQNAYTKINAVQALGTIVRMARC
jgi:hypothetical protein